MLLRAVYGLFLKILLFILFTHMCGAYQNLLERYYVSHSNFTSSGCFESFWIAKM